ncbi:MAG TPA: ABC transporter substrate-binding protein [Candidatus Lustribacter sp.]|jgi:NitT/TauT family transport system substrate-binding protein|nr:ABC transporter substrate-binding protein [Candidatus Lustribacter sp.]
MNRRTTLSALAAATALGFPRGARAADPTPLQLGTMGADGSAEPFYGVDHGFFKDAGLDVKITVMQNTAQLASAVAGNALDIGYGSVIPVAQAHLRGLEFRVIAPAFEAGGPVPTNLLLVAANSTIKTGADLNGATVAVNGLRDLSQYETQAWIDQNGGDIKTVKLIEIPFPEMGVAVASGRVAAAISAEPFTTVALSGGQVRVLGNASASVGRHYVATCWFATPAWLQANADTARRLQSTMLKIAKWANANHADTQAIILKYTKITPEVAAKMVRTTYGETKITAALLQPVIDLAVKYGGMAPVSAADLIWQG